MVYTHVRRVEVSCKISYTYLLHAAESFLRN